MRLVALVFALLCATLPARPALAQAAPAPAACRLGTATALLDVGDVEARVFNTGSLFYASNGTRVSAAYEVPKGTGKSPVYAAGLWVGGLVGGQLRVSGGSFGPAPGMDFTLWPGPLGPDARPVDPTDCSPFDRIYTVSRADVQRYNETGVLTDDLRDWPAALGAPVIDGDGDPANYSLAGGDQPAIRGDQTAWWLANDVGNVHPAQATPPLGIEVRTEAVAFAARPLSQTTLYRYTITNRTAATIDQAYVGLFADPDLGDAGDDLVGTDTTRAMMFTYNADNQDGTGVGDSYGAAPPAVGFQVVEGPVGLPNGRDDDRDGTADEPGERLRATASAHFNGRPDPSGDPNTGAEMYAFLRGFWGDGTVRREFGDGYQETQGAVTPFAYAGDPVTGRVWSEVNPGTGIPANLGSDRRMMVATGPFRLGPGQSETVTFAIPFGRGASNLASITALRDVAGAVAGGFAAGYLEPSRVGGTPPVLPADDRVRLSAPQPNPFTRRAVVRYAMPAGTRLRATLLDVLGREIAVLVDGPTLASEGEIAVDGAGLAPGVYRVRVVVPGAERFVTLVRIR